MVGFGGERSGGAGGVGADGGGLFFGDGSSGSLHECPSALSYSTGEGGSLKLDQVKWREGKELFLCGGGERKRFPCVALACLTGRRAKWLLCSSAPRRHVLAIQR